MTTQSEQTLEQNLIAQLISMGYQQVILLDELSMVANLRVQLQLHNDAGV